ncbi:MAG: hypothetical protein ACTSRR_06585 [Candidatus Heimdallarchaeaceae archaeon]
MSIDIDLSPLSHPSTLKLFLFAKSCYPDDFGVREAKRKLEFHSISNVAWHLNKLEEAGLIEKLPSNRYKLLENSLKIKEIEVPVTLTAQLIKDEIIPKKVFLLSFMITATIATIIVAFFNPLVAALNGILLLVINCVFYLEEYFSAKKQLSFYKWKEKRKNN